MNKLHIEGSKSTPTVILDAEKNNLFLQGQSYPENAFKFYEPIFQWVDEYLEKLTAEVLVQIDFNLPYINTSSSKCIMMLLEKLDKAYASGKKLTLNWYYNEDNESELECAEEFKEDLTFPFNITSRENK
ncbi:DUF1987 domain-containing protein [Desulforamulus aeronauticus]|uniref:SiaC family regulatory phosphoprotein domain-containing protein n=1 Tax=Desulforamulus aeronauticus DSM 10349 TaxID=1121421 RepID=A0A1M6U1G2_9FIRM|nr:DUF1987 domain-containing protein [Desulforamulus aeronauticus]SHK62993.1 protein of unknown function [Desulforamulus aeronauticus DSM 10349]